MTDPVTAFAVLVGLGTIIWFALGRPGRHRQRAHDRRRLGGRPAHRTGFFSMPNRDRDYLPGVLLALMATWNLADVVTGSAASVGLIVLAAVLAALYAARPDLVGAGLGVVGVVALGLDRMGSGSNCVAYSRSDTVAFWVGAGLIVLVLAGLRLVLTPVRAAQRVLTGPVSFWSSAGRARRPGPIATVSLATFGALDLLDLATRPGALHVPTQWSAATIGFAVALAVAAGFLAFALTVLPSFTLSVLGVGTLAGAVFVDAVTPSCTNWFARIAIAVAFFLVNRVAARVL